MSELKIYVNAQFGNIRAIDENGKVWFIAVDVARALGYRNTKQAVIDHVSKKHKMYGVGIRDSIGRIQQAIAIDEAGLYSLVLRSKLPRAEAFQEWVVSEVLPSIRNTGSYSTKPIERTSGDLNIKVLAKAVAAELKKQEMRALPQAKRCIYIDEVNAYKARFIEEAVRGMEQLDTDRCSVVCSFIEGLLNSIKEKAIKLTSLGI